MKCCAVLALFCVLRLPGHGLAPFLPPCLTECARRAFWEAGTVSVACWEASCSGRGGLNEFVWGGGDTYQGSWPRAAEQTGAQEGPAPFPQ